MRENCQIHEIVRAITKNIDILTEASISKDDVAPQELVEYFSGDTPTGDTTTLKDVISQPWLLLHELVELKHLKLRGFVISRRLVWDNFQDVLEAHIAATVVELKIASNHGDREWVSRRVELIPSWLEDSEMPYSLRTTLLNLAKRYKQ